MHACPLQKVKRAVSSYAFYVKEHMPAMLRTNPSFGVTQAMPLLSQKWKTLPASVKAPYEQRAAADKARADADRARVAAAHPKRPPTQFIKFSVEQRPAVVKATPHLTFGEIGKEIARRWKALSDAQKAVSVGLLLIIRRLTCALEILIIS
jgi:hypothetical protein